MRNFPSQIFFLFSKASKKFNGEEKRGVARLISRKKRVRTLEQSKNKRLVTVKSLFVPTCPEQLTTDSRDSVQ